MLLSNTTSGSLGTYTLDSSSSSQLITPPPGSSYPIYNFEILTATPSSADSHTLEIKAEDANAFYLDYVLLQTGSAFVTNTETTGSGSSGSDSGSNSGSGGGSSSGSDGGDNDGDNNSGGGSRGTNVSAIAGGVVGGVVALAAISLVIFFWLRRRRDRREFASKGQFDIAEEDRYVDTPGRGDAQGEGQEQGQAMPMGMYQRQRAESGK